MAGISSARRILLVKEVTAGTQVKPATAIFRDNANDAFEDLRGFTMVDEDIGYVSGVDRSYISFLLSQFKLNPHTCTFEQLPYLFNMAIKGVSVGVADGGGSGKIYSYPLPTTAPNGNVLQTYSVQSGDDQQVEFGAFLFCVDFHLSGAAQQAVMMDGMLQCRSADPNVYTASTISFDNLKHISDSANGLAVFPIGSKIVVSGTVNNNGTFTVTASAAGQLTVTENTATEAAGTPVKIEETWSIVSLPTVEDILFQNGKLFIDAVGGVLGNTQVTSSWLAFDLKVATGWSARFSGDGNLYFTRAAFGGKPKMKVDLDITLEHDAFAVAEKVAARAQTARQMRLQFNGSALAVAGTKYSTKALRMDFAGKYKPPPALAEDNSNDTETLSLDVSYDPTAALFCNLEVCNLLSTLP